MMRYMTVLIISLTMTYAYSDSRVKSIVDDVTSADYDNAIKTTVELNEEGKEDLIKEAIDTLFKNGERNLLDYGYKLKHSYPGSEIYPETFPEKIQRILNGKQVRLINRRDLLSLKLAIAPDNAGDRTAFGDANGELLTRIAWTFKPKVENNSLTFNIVNVKYNQNLKLGVKADYAGDHILYGGTDLKGERDSWYLEPKRFKGDDLFYIVNKHFNQALKLGRSEDSVGDRTAFGHNGAYRDYPEYFAWFVNEY